MSEEKVAIIGGTGDLGFGLALRWACTGVSVVIGSRDAAKAEAAAGKVLARLGELSAKQQAGLGSVTGVEVVTSELLAAVDSEIIRGVLADRFVVECPNVTPHPGDVRFRLSHDDVVGTNCTVFRAYWSPRTHEVEFRGGPADGRVMFVSDLGGALRFPVMRPFSFSTDAEFPEEALAYDVAVCRLAGWENVARRWVFTETT